MKSILVCVGQEIKSSSINKSLSERISEGEKELLHTLNERHSLIMGPKLIYSYFKETLLVNQLSILTGMRDGAIVHKIQKYSRKTSKGLGRAWSADPVFDYLLEYNHREFEARGGWEAYNDETMHPEDEFDAYRMELFVILDF